MTALPLAALAILCLLLTVGLIPFVRRLARRLGLVDDPAGGAYKTHREPIPYGGGVAMYVGVGAPLAGLLLAASGTGATPLALQQVTALAAAASAVFLVGLLDDWRQLPPLLRLLVQFAAAALLAFYYADFRLTLFAAPTPVAAALAVVWVVAMTNAFNFLDNMDGLAAGLAVIALTAIGVLALAVGHWPAAACCLFLAGAAAGFLFFNFPPASIFMGDAGGLLLGFTAGAVSVLVSSSLNAAAAVDGNAFPNNVAPLLALAVPLYDLVSVVLIRLQRRLPPWLGDTNHVSHRLVRLGMSRRGGVLTLYAVAALSAAASLALVYSSARTALGLLAAVVVAVAVAAGLDRRARHRSLGTE